MKKTMARLAALVFLDGLDQDRGHVTPEQERKRVMKPRAFLFALLILLLIPACEQDKEYDIVILNGRVMDPETNLDAVRNVGIKDGIISIITGREIRGRETIDAEGLVVAPGFIDGHQHAIEPYVYRLMVRDGRTTIMDLEVGAFGPMLDEWYSPSSGSSPPKSSETRSPNRRRIRPAPAS